MSRSFDTVVVGGDADGLVAAAALARGGSKVLLVEERETLGGALREIEFAPGLRVAPLAPDTETTQIALGGDEPLMLYRDVSRTAEGLQRISRKDAARWPAFAAQVARFIAFLGELYRAPPPRIDAQSFGEFSAMARLALKFRRLGKADMIELMRVLPMSAADWFDDWFESDRLKGLLAAYAVKDVAQGPMSGGTAFTFLHRHVGAMFASSADSIVVLAERARAAGVVIETGTTAQRVLVREDRVAGVRLTSGEEIACREVLSSLDPQRSLLELLDPKYLEVELIQAVGNIRYRGVTTKILLALDSMPQTLGRTMVVAPSVRYVERAYDAVKYGRVSEEPIIELRFAGERIAVLHVQYTPYGSKESIADRALEIAERHVPGLTTRIRERTVLMPRDLESQFGLREGAISQGETMLDQMLFMRPVAGWSRYAMPVPGFYLCGAGTHPGPGITGMSGQLAARAVRAAR